MGYLISGSEKIDEDYDYYEDEVIYQDKIDFMDTQGIKAKISLNTGFGIWDASVNYAGLVANAGNPLIEFDSTLPYSSSGNKIEIVSGMLIPIGNVWLLPHGLFIKPDRC